MDIQKDKKTKENIKGKRKRGLIVPLFLAYQYVIYRCVQQPAQGIQIVDRRKALTCSCQLQTKKKIDFFVPSNITSHYTCYCSILKAIFILAEERSATFSRHSKLCNHPSYLKNGSSVFHTISILSSPLIITFLITFWIFSLSKDSILMILSNCVSNLLEELSSGGISVLSCSIS